MPAPENLPPLIRTDGTNPFAHQTMRVRHPRMISEVMEANPDYPPIIAEELGLLYNHLVEDAPLMMLNLFPTPTPDYIDWASALVNRGGRNPPDERPTWLSTDWFFAETLLFRLIVEASRWWETRRDPFAPFKQQELQGEAVWALLAEALSLDGGTYDRLPELLRMATLGNRIDLSHPDSVKHGTQAGTDDLLTDDAEVVRAHLLDAGLEYFPQESRGVVHMIIDNAGTELAMDLALADTLLTGFCDVVILHTKFHPTFVSDATNSDVLMMLRRCEHGPHGGGLNPVISAMGARLAAAFTEGRLRLASNLFWTTPQFMWDMPRQLQAVFEDSELVIIKGDANYRRLIGDAIWDPTLPLEKIVSYFPAPLVALRTLKSDPLVGVDAAQIRALDAQDPQWRTNGQRAVIQFVGAASPETNLTRW